MELQDYEIKHLEMLREYLSECTVLLKKDGSFPLNGPCDIALYGNGARNTIKGGTGSGEVYSRFFVTAEEGLKQNGFRITTTDWLDTYDDIWKVARNKFIEEIKEYAWKNRILTIVAAMGAVMKEPDYELPLNGEGDTCVYVLSRISGEGNDRSFVKGDILLTDTEVRDILKLNESYERFMLVLNIGGPVDLSPVNDVKNILVLSQLGVETGSALADLLLGKTCPSGKLTTTWATKETYPSIGDFGELNDTRYKEGIYVGYRYFDAEEVEPLYPFGYGLSYTEFEHAVKKVRVQGSVVTADVEVRNSGAYQGKEVIQLYVSKPCTRQDQAKRELIAFKKTKELKPNESELLSICFDMKDVYSFNESDENYYLEKGDYILYAGNSSRDLKAERVLHLNEEVILKQVRKAVDDPDFEDVKFSYNREDIKGLEVLAIDPSVFETKRVDYETEEEIPAFIKAMSDEELAAYNMGAFDPKGGLSSQIGSASVHVAGAAGETTSIYHNKEIPVLVMSDGPAGIRIAQKAYRDEKGAHSLNNQIPESLMDFLSPTAKLVMKFLSRKPAKNVETYEQYCTAIPIGTAIAQSFNEEFAKICGDIVGEEMEHFGIQLWLAPALNIHRSIRCGRNFEYYSEDPLLSGKMAAAITKGVQAHKGCGVTIKHYCCNNQEYNRCANNAVLSERALREIYLRGFEYCIENAQPCAFMSSYNLVNGVHAGESKRLISDVLYKEFGHEGLVMTDWVIGHGILEKNSVYEGSYADTVAAAGVCLFMPGSNEDYKELLNGLKKNTVSRSQMEANTARLCRAVAKLKGETQ